MDQIFWVIAALVGFILGRLSNNPDYHHYGDLHDVAIRPVHRDVKPHPANGKEITIEYRDGAGKETTRTVKILSIGTTKRGNKAIMAYCNKRENVRQFRLDRIKDVIDSDGIIHDPADYFGTMAA